ncbi:hypothetical protein [Sulfitobacter sp.]|uniref:hypothetical protein n=1 Tax=Sulfitobacter sp. TaxID=1903071 RepID=UPI0039E555C8
MTQCVLQFVQTIEKARVARANQLCLFIQNIPKTVKVGKGVSGCSSILGNFGTAVVDIELLPQVCQIPRISGSRPDNGPVELQIFDFELGIDPFGVIHLRAVNRLDSFPKAEHCVPCDQDSHQEGQNQQASTPCAIVAG